MLLHFQGKTVSAGTPIRCLYFSPIRCLYFSPKSCPVLHIPPFPFLPDMPPKILQSRGLQLPDVSIRLGKRLRHEDELHPDKDSQQALPGVRGWTMRDRLRLRGRPITGCIALPERPVDHAQQAAMFLLQTTQNASPAFPFLLFFYYFHYFL